jgi:ABC-type lipoprotein release transport system permease subunit
MAKLMWPGENPVGRTLHEVRQRGREQVLTVVGIVKDARLTELDRAEALIFTTRGAHRGQLLLRRDAALLEAIRRTARELNPAAEIEVRPLAANLREYLSLAISGASMASALGLIALSMAVVGVFGVFAHAVEERRREIGIRLALGARASEIVRALAASNGRALLAGLAVGLAVSLLSAPVLGSFLYGLSPLDPLAYIGATLVLGVSAVTATFVPARRACRVDPAVTLRAD